MLPDPRHGRLQAADVPIPRAWRTPCGGGFQRRAPFQRRGVLLLREVDRAHRMCGELAGCSSDHRNRDFVEHDLALMLRQRIPGIAQGYEDLDDHERLRQGVKAIPRRSRAALPHD